ncbi:MAG: TolC family protein, partial [Gemmatimonadaceae bacterium]
MSAGLPRAIVTSAVFALATADNALAQSARADHRDIPGKVNVLPVVEDSLALMLGLASTANPSILAARDRAIAARSRVRIAGTRPDPFLMIGAVNVPVRSLNFSEADMTMKMVGIRQNLPYPGKLALRVKISALQAIAAEASAESVRLAVFRDVKTAWYELEYTNAALDIARRKAAVLSGVSSVATARYATGGGMQQDVLRATLDATRLNESTNALVEAKAAIVARINELLDRPTETAVMNPVISRKLLGAALDSGALTGFVSRNLGASVGGSPLPTLLELQALAVALNPGLRAKGAMAAAANTELELARKEHLPDIDVSLQYGQRSGFTRG